MTADGRFTPSTLGKALIAGYTNLDIPLGKPFLRAAVRAMCEGKAAARAAKESIRVWNAVERRGSGSSGF